MRLLRHPHILAWLVTGMLGCLVFAAGPLIVVAMTRLMLLSGTDTHRALWLLSGTVGALKVSVAAAVVLTALHLFRRLTAA